MKQVAVLYDAVGEKVVATCDEDRLEEVARILRVLHRLYPLSTHSPSIDPLAARIAAPLKDLLHWRKENELLEVSISKTA